MNEINHFCLEPEFKKFGRNWKKKYHLANELFFKIVDLYSWSPSTGISGLGKSIEENNIQLSEDELDLIIRYNEIFSRKNLISNKIETEYLLFYPNNIVL